MQVLLSEGNRNALSADREDSRSDAELTTEVCRARLRTRGNLRGCDREPQADQLVGHHLGRAGRVIGRKDELGVLLGEDRIQGLDRIADPGRASIDDAVQVAHNPVVCR